ncbi:class I adenylate-forming enzyme family protein [Acrocarpospora catenulata]|uniref:class I adenylate-forming enzyme family protein n=1 Tax=Acrocarpospora catenulata TaxID=2836182 RepID=UPI001BDA1EAC|nr:class I adenylate-forming enzyme family protein [Acrocarpospora catenulata]
MNLAWWLDRSRAERPQHPALIECDSGLTVGYAELADRADRIAGVLADLGVGEDDIVVTLMPDDAWHVATFFGVLKVGAVFSGFNRVLAEEKFVADIERMRARTIVVSSAFLPTAERLRAATCLELILVCDEERADGRHNLRPLAEAHRGLGRVTPRTEDQLAAINYTGGTSGVSKGVMFTHGTLGLSARLTASYQGMTSGERNLSFISLYHSGGIHDAVTWAMLGATNILTGGWRVDQFVRAVEHYRPTWMKAWVPTMVRDLFRHPEWENVDLRGISCSLGGEKVPKEMREALRARGMRVTDTYGLTESMPWLVLGAPLVYGDEADIPSGSCGKPQREFCEVVLKDPETGAVITEPDVPGEVCIRGGVVSPGYYNDPERTAAAFDADGFFHTRDLAYFDADGWYYIHGRVDDIINCGGEKVSLVEVENVLKASPLVRDAACVGVPHERFGEIPAACVVPADDLDLDEPALAERLDAHCIAAFERWKRPRLYVKVDAVPRTLPKRTKDMAALRALVAEVSLRDEEGVTSLGKHLARRGRA